MLERVTYSYFIPFVANSAAIVLADSCIPLPIHSSIHPKVVKHKRQGVKFEKSSRIAKKKSAAIQTALCEYLGSCLKAIPNLADTFYNKRVVRISGIELFA